MDLEQQVIDKDLVDAIIVESGTETPEQLEASLAAGGTVVEEEQPPAEVTELGAKKAPVTEPTKVELPADARSEFEQEIDQLDPPQPGENAEQRKLRYSKNERAIILRLRRAKTAEDRAATAEAELVRLKATAPLSTIGQPTTVTAPAKTIEHPSFTFQTWDQYSEANPEASHEDYLDARGDARETWKAEKTAKEDSAAAAVRDTARRRDALETLDRDKLTRIEAYRLDHPEYDVAMNTDEAKALPFPPVMHVKMAESTLGPKIAHYLALHPERHLVIAEQEMQLHAAELNPRAIAAIIGAEIRKLEIELKGDTPVTSAAASAAATTTAAPAAATTAAAPAASTTFRVAPSKPQTAAPAPVREIAGGAQPTRDSYALGNDGEDADQYIVQRLQERKQMGLRG